MKINNKKTLELIENKLENSKEIKLVSRKEGEGLYKAKMNQVGNCPLNIDRSISYSLSMNYRKAIKLNKSQHYP